MMEILDIQKEQLESIDWEYLIETADIKPYYELSILERAKDLKELMWLMEQCLLKVKEVERIFSKSSLEIEMVNIIRQHCKLLSQQLEIYKNTPQKCTFLNFIKLKYNIRAVFKNLSGILTSSDWQSPAISTGSLVKEKGIGQINEDVYMRMNGHEFVTNFQDRFFSEYYRIPLALQKKTLGVLTNSGMKALEMALIAYKTITKDIFPIYFQEGYYFEGITLIKNIYSNAECISSTNIYQKIENNEDIGCLLIDPGTTWPIRDGINLDLFFEKLKHHRQKKPLFIIIDRTITSITNSILEKYEKMLPSHVVLIIVESGIKYFQLGLDLTNLGFVTFTGNIFRMKDFVDIINHLSSVLSAIPDPVLLQRLPDPNLPFVEERLDRMARNTRLLCSFFKYMVGRNLIKEVNTSVSMDKKYQINEYPWIGTLIYVKTLYSESLSDYANECENIVRNIQPNINIYSGSSFGFDTTRLCVVEEMFSSKLNCALRISVGRETIYETLQNALYLYNYFVNNKINDV